MPGHWEGDFIKGAGNQSSVGVLVERSSRLVLLAKMDDAAAASALAGFSAKLNSIAEPMRHSLTYDQGKEMSLHAELREQTGVNIYFCDPHSPLQRGTCENTNGLLRQYMPKGTDLSIHTQDDLDAIADSLNNRPRATHEFNTPLAVFAAMLELAQRAPTRLINQVLRLGLETAVNARYKGALTVSRTRCESSATSAQRSSAISHLPIWMELSQINLQR